VAVYPNNRHGSANPYRLVGGAAPGFDARHTVPSARRNRFTNAAWSAASGGDRATGLLPGTPGALTAYHSNSAAFAVADAPLGAGYSLDGSTGATLDVSPVALHLRAFCFATVSVKLTVSNAFLAQEVSMHGSCTAGSVIVSSVLTATANLGVLSSPIAMTLSAHLTATGWLAGTIRLETPLSPETLAARVEDALAPRLNTLQQQVGITLALAAAG
jgi:hypothetical protein